MGEWGSRQGRGLLRAPRTKPDVRLARIRLPPWVFDGDALVWPRVLDARTREPLSDQLRYVRPCLTIFLTAPPKCAQQEIGDMVVERHERAEISRHGVVGEVASDILPKPAPLFGNRLMHVGS